MNKLFFILAITSLAFAACKDNKQPDKHDMDTMNKDSAAQTTPSTSDADIKTVSASFTTVDVQIAASLKEIVGHYLHIKNALASDDEAETASGGKAMLAAMEKLDKSLFTADQKKVYDENEEDLKEHAEHISKSKLDHQREHFSMMSEEMYVLVKAFGGGRTLYRDHCPMYNNNKGAIWLSETVTIKNPYMGSKMPTCGKAEEKLQ